MKRTLLSLRGADVTEVEQVVAQDVENHVAPVCVDSNANSPISVSVLVMYGSFHGGQFWESIGPRFDKIEARQGVINADVLDAWFPPAPEVVEALSNSGEWISRTSPPTHAEGLQQAIAEARGLPADAVLPGPGSSALLYLAWRALVTAQSRVLIVEPSYGEYAYLAEEVIGATVDRYELRAENGFAFDPNEWLAQVVGSRPDIAVLVNPNNPTGTRFDVAQLAQRVPSTTMLWIDEAYLDYTSEMSAERLAVEMPNVVVLKSLSKVFALSGLRTAYLVTNPELVNRLRAWVPPWWVSLPAQIASVAALGCAGYYADRYAETHQLRRDFEEKLKGVPVEVVGSEANWVLLRLPMGVSAAAMVRALETQGIYVRNAGATAESLGDSYLRVAVKPNIEQASILEGLAGALLLGSVSA